MARLTRVCLSAAHDEHGGSEALVAGQHNEVLATVVGHGQAPGKNPEFAKLTRRLGFEYNGHEGWPAGFEPLLVMDVSKHTGFMCDYKATERGKVIAEAFFRSIDWWTIERRLHETRPLRLAS